MAPSLSELLSQHVWGLLRRGAGGGVVAARICISDKIPDDADAAGPHFENFENVLGPHIENHSSKTSCPLPGPSQMVQTSR